MTVATETKKPRAGQQRFKGQGFPVPDAELEGAASSYAKAMTAETNAKAKKKSQLDTLIETMTRKGVTEVRFTYGGTEKILRLESKERVKIEVVRESKDSPEPEADE